MTGSSPFDFIFEQQDAVSLDSLYQGDLLSRTPQLADAVAQAHRYYAEALDYSHFLVLTQSCDLVRRKGSCKSRYITLCAVRPLSLAISRELEKYVEPIDGFPVPVGNLDNNILARQFLERVLNNTVDGLFFIPKDSADTVEDHLCAFLALSIAIRIDHYDVCLAAKVAQTREIFSAKIGSLASSLYSRIATPDLGERRPKTEVDAYKRAFFEELGLTSVAWLSRHQQKVLKDRVSKKLEGEDADVVSASDAQELLARLPDEATAIAQRVEEVLVSRQIVSNDEDTRRRLRNFLINDKEFRQLARR